MTRYEELIVLNDRRNAAIAAFVLELLARGERPGIVFARRQKHATRLAAALRDRGVSAPVVTALTPMGERNALLTAMRAGSLRVVVACPVWSTGIDIPELSWVLLTGSGSAPVGLNQASGRATRTAPGKLAFTVYDLCDVGLDAGGSFLTRHAERRWVGHRAAGFVREDPQALLAELRTGKADRVAPVKQRRGVGRQPVEPVDGDILLTIWALRAIAGVLIFVMLAQFSACLLNTNYIP